jgi:hypothetical protein
MVPIDQHSIGLPHAPPGMHGEMHVPLPLQTPAPPPESVHPVPYDWNMLIKHIGTPIEQSIVAT